MKVKIYDTVQDFLGENEEQLLKKESVTQLILHNCFVNKEKEHNQEMLFGRVEDGEENIKLIFVNAKPFNLLVHTLDNYVIESVEALADYLVDNEIGIRGINANKKFCDEFMKCYSNKTGYSFKEYLAMDIMEITKLNKGIILPKGNFREAKVEDTEVLIDWHVKFAKEALGEDVPDEAFRDRLNERIENKSIYIFEDEEYKLMSMAVVSRQLVNGISINQVYSCKEARGKGFGVAIMYNLSKEYLGIGNKFCSLFVDKKNPVSNGVYKKIGYRILEDNYDYRIENISN